MVIRARSLLARRLLIDYPKEGPDLLFLAELAGEMIGLGEEGIADRQFLSIFGVYTSTAPAGINPKDRR